jgi:signal transduction histidine kinase
MTAPADRLRAAQIRTTAVATITVAVVLAIGAVGLVRYVERQQLDQVDQRLTATARVIPSAAAAPRAAIPQAANIDVLVQAVDKDGNVVYAADRLRGLPAIRPTNGQDLSRPETESVEGFGPVRVAAVHLGGTTVLVGEPLQSVDDAVSSLTTALLVGVPLLAIVLGVIVWFVVGRTLRPARKALEREQRLLADVSHELRTPLAGARALLESESTVPAEVELNRLEALAMLTRLEDMTNQLMAEARSRDPERMRLDELVDLDDVVLRVVTRTPGRPGIRIDTSAVSAGQVRGNEADLERMVTNLVTNAIRHAGAEVWIVLGEHDGTVTLTVADDGQGIPADDQERIFERFTRLDDARARDQGGAGLGLPIARSVAAAHGGTIIVTTPEGRGATFVVALPASTTPTRVPARNLSGP